MKETLKKTIAVLMLVLFIVAPYLYPQAPYAQAVTNVVTFTAVGTTSWIAPQGVSSVDYLIVAGGGGGGYANDRDSAGGGGGGVLTGTASVVPGNSYTVIVGKGGTGSSLNIDPTNGSSSSFSSFTATGGGLGGFFGSICWNGGNGGSGGGGYHNVCSAAGTGTGGQGSNGGTGFDSGNPTNGTFTAGGGGGASAAGSNGVAANGGAGGAGVSSSISGSSVTYGGGGGGGCQHVGTGSCSGGSGGSGGGGGGGSGTNVTAVNGTAGTANTGGGGGGGGGGSGVTSANGGAGGSGIVILSFNASQLTITVNTKAAVNFDARGSVSKGSGTFAIDHPLDPVNKILFHSFVESPDVKNIYDGVVTLDTLGSATIQLPAYFDALNNNVRYQFFPIDIAMPGLYISKQESGNSFTISGGEPGGRVSWQITRIRHDPYIRTHPITPEVDKGPNQPVNKGDCLYEPLCK